MDYDVVRTSVQNAYKNFNHNDKRFYNAMYDFYKEGKKNPTVAKIIMQDHIFKSRNVVKEMFNDASQISFTDMSVLLYPEMTEVQNRVYGMVSNAAIKSVLAEDLYKNISGFGSTYSTSGIEYVKKEFNTAWGKLYPKTGKIRERIIEANRLEIGKITTKADWFAKINYAKTFAEYHKDYPKTFNARYSLIMNNQIEEESVTTRVKGWFRRFAYKGLIKDGFGFKKD